VVEKTLTDLDREIADYGKALELNPKDADVLCNRGFAYGEKRELEKAIEDFESVKAIDPEYAMAYWGSGITCYAMGEFERCLNEIRQAASLGYEIDPNFITMLQNLQP